jgi:hypothetical protein
MNKMILTAVVAAGLAGSLFAQGSNEATDLSIWLQKYYCQQYNVPYLTPSDPGYDEAKKDQTGMFSMPVSAYTLQSEMWNKIQQEYPMPADLQASVAALENKKNASLQALAQKYGYSSMDELWCHVKDDPKLLDGAIYEQQRAINNDWGTANAALTASYQNEFNNRWQTALIETIKRIQENAKVMNPQK